MADFTSDETSIEQFQNPDASEEVLNSQLNYGVDDESELFENGVQINENSTAQEADVLETGTGDTGGQESSSNQASSSGSAEGTGENTGNFTSGENGSTGNDTRGEASAVQQTKETQYTIDDIYRLLEEYQTEQKEQTQKYLNEIGRIKTISRSSVAVLSIILGLVIVYMFIGRLR